MCVATGRAPRRLPAIIEVGGQYLELKVKNGLKQADFNRVGSPGTELEFAL